MMKILKAVGLLLTGVVIFILGVLLESSIRSRYREAIPVENKSVSAVVTAFVQPDLLGAGRMWWIDVETEQPSL